MQTNLYDFLRSIHDQAKGAWGDAVITEQQWEWLETFLRNPGTVIEFRSRPTGKLIAFDIGGIKMGEPFDSPLPELEVAHEPEIEKHFAIAGDPQEVFALLYEAMTLNPLLAQVMISACRAYLDSAPMCRSCGQRHPGKPIEDCPDLGNPSWEFKERKK